MRAVVLRTGRITNLPPSAKKKSFVDFHVKKACKRLLNRESGDFFFVKIKVRKDFSQN